uniref:Retrovirus-related Pol polyprotein from transposon TNT 1-94 n=1 Tax=Nicotiana tabacum TaxID=4097 RepID=A0A1S3Z4U5_TOBAC|nr:PREDICTED: uncharacterized protein LOC107783044 [Nicotiana tabacum]
MTAQVKGRMCGALTASAQAQKRDGRPQKRNLDIVLTAEDYKFVIAEECLEKPENATDDKHQSMGSAYDMLESLKEMFGEQNRVAKQTSVKALLNTKMVEGSSVKDHVLKMMSLLNELEVLGAVIDKESQVEMVLQTLPDSFQQFCLNYNLNKMDLSLAKLLNELQVVESIIKQQALVMALNVEKASVSKLKGSKKKKKAQKVLAPGGAAGVKKPKGKCYHCKQPASQKAMPYLSGKVE